MYVRDRVQILSRPTATGLTVEQVLADKILVFLRQVLSIVMRAVACFMILPRLPRVPVFPRPAKTATRLPTHRAWQLTHETNRWRVNPHALHMQHAPHMQHMKHMEYMRHVKNMNSTLQLACSLCRRSDMHSCAHKPGASALGRLHGKDPRLGDHHVRPVCM